METLQKIRLIKEPTEMKRIKITSSIDSEKCIRGFYGDDIELYESFFLLLLDQSNTTIGFVKISQGGISACIVDVRLVAKYCVESLCSACVIAHNHPSGNLQPSSQDYMITEKIKKGLEYFDVRLLDHIILTKESYLSISDEMKL